ncbi:histone deacetylase family protein [Parasphingorhabdus sp. DH2-15]|uniref:histone deacetylase family protein n=1 Tax=Parasphingorhabdus sp. DH2-15 TaxID=3444112 RepID=UPI003F685C82
MAMPIFFDPAQRAHNPPTELHNGGFVPYAEHVGRVDALISALEAKGFTPQMPHNYGMAPIRAVHDDDYLAFLQSAYDRWKAAGRDGDVTGYAWPVVGRRPLKLNRIDGDIGQYSFDAATPIAQETWGSAYANAQTALAAVDALGQDDIRAALALCRPPGHHAGANYLGGYCYLNNVAIATQHALSQGAEKVVILDVDYHHGNGTQDIFYARDDVDFISLHADPRTDFPFFWGHGDEMGEGAGLGHNHNFPLPRGTDWSAYQSVLRSAVNLVQAAQPDMLLISFGADTLSSDPISQLALTTDDFGKMGAMIAALKLPTAIIMEGGYAVDDIGTALSNFVAAF